MLESVYLREHKGLFTLSLIKWNQLNFSLVFIKWPLNNITMCVFVHICFSKHRAIILDKFQNISMTDNSRIIFVMPEDV